MGRSRRVVEYKGSSPGLRAGRAPRLWAYGYADIARLLGTTEEAIRIRSKRGKLQPGDLESVCRAWASARGLVLAAALALAASASIGCVGADEGPGGSGGELVVDAGQPGTGGSGGGAELGTGGSTGAGTGGAAQAGVGGSPAAGTGGSVAGTGGAAVVGTGGSPGTGGSVPTIPECNGTGRAYSVSFCGYLAANGFEWVYSFKDGLRCATCFASAGTRQTTECLDSIDDPAALCVNACSDCAQ